MADRDAKARYGFGQQFLNSNPEVKRLVNKAARQNYTPQRFEYELRQTKWYRNKTNAQREWSVLEKTQPKEASRQIAERKGEIQRAAQRMGIRLTANEVNRLARNSLRNGWNDGELQFKIGAKYEYEDSTRGIGQASTVAAEIRALMRDYGLAMGTNTLAKWTEQVLQGVATVEDIQGRLVNEAKGKYGAIAGDLDRGLTVDQLFDPYRQSAAELLGRSPNEIDVRDPGFSQVFSYQPPGENGRRTMTLEEWERSLRTDQQYGFDQTQNAMSLAARLGAELQTEMGRRG